MNPVIRKLHEAQLRKDLPEFRPGDTVKVNVRLLEGEGEKVKERIQAYEGVVISKKGRASSATFTVRRVSFGMSVGSIESSIEEKVQTVDHGPSQVFGALLLVVPQRIEVASQPVVDVARHMHEVAAVWNNAP